MANSAEGEKSFSRHPDIVRAALAKALRKLGWQSANGSNGSIAAIWTSPVFHFKDDVTIVLAPVEKGTRVRARSKSRVGRYDFGQNAKHVRELFTEIQKAL
jgi:uncharacterized protein (DUF1499 family)